MLNVILGTDREKINSFIKKSVGETQAQKIDIFSWDTDLVRSNIESSSLFGGESEGLILEGIGENGDLWNALLGLVGGMTESAKSFFVVESDLSDEAVEILKEKGAKISDFREKKQEKWKPKYGNETRLNSKVGQKYNPFALADAVGKKSAKEAWIEYERARLAGALPEELHGQVWGKVRDMIASEVATATELGIHPFVHKKAKADLRNWPRDILNKFTDNLLNIYHESRLGGDELDLAMEKLLLSI